MTKTGARQGCIAIQPLHLRHGVGAGRAGKGAGRKGTGQVGAQARGTGGGGGRLGALRHGRLACDTTGQPGHDTTLVAPQYGRASGLCA